MSDWIQWKRVYDDKIAHVAGFEEKFVDLVLSQIPAICPADVVPQYQFSDAKGGKRYIDFMIINPSKGYLLPIELDGRNKPNVGKEDWNDFLGRQNDLIRSFRTVMLRYSNEQMFKFTNVIIREISEELLIQAADKSRRDRLREALEEFAKLPKQDPPQDIPSNVTHSSRSAWQPYMAASVAVFATVVLGYFIWQNGSRPYSAVREAPTATASIGMTRTPQISVAVPDVAVHETRAAAASIGMKETPNTAVAGSDAGSLSGDFIPASQAQAYVGQHKRVCGHIAKLRETSAGLFINLDKPYPNDAMSAIIWRKNIDKIGRLQLTEKQRVCVSGLIQAYNGKTQIEIDRREQIMP